jgi:hypothetical protein
MATLVLKRQHHLLHSSIICKITTLFKTYRSGLEVRLANQGNIVTAESSTVAFLQLYFQVPFFAN